MYGWPTVSLADVCGRFVSTASAGQIAGYFDAVVPEDTVDLGDRYNVAPTNDVYAVIERPDQVREVRTFEWGLLPVWAKDDRMGSKLINARAETLLEKNSFKASYQRRRCLIPMGGFYEWIPGHPGGPTNRKGELLRQPLLIERKDHELLAVAGLWSAWRPAGSAEDVPWRHTCTVVTTEANATIRPVHDRMPVILDRPAWESWLDPAGFDPAVLGALLIPAPDALLEMHEVSTDVNNVRNKGPF